MDAQSRLKLMSVVFAVLWTVGMAWWTARSGWVHITILAVCGSVAALLWYWGMSRYLRWHARHRQL